MLKIKALSFFIKALNGRNNKGHLTSRNKGGGCKNFYNIYNLQYKVFGLPYKIIKSKCFFYKAFFLDLVCYKNGFLSYVKSVEGLNADAWCLCYSSGFKYVKGDKLRVKFLAIGTLIFDIENMGGNGACFARSQGSFAKILSQYFTYTLIQLKSGEQRLISNECFCTVGQAAFSYVFFKSNITNAGDNRLLGRRPHVRGVAMNPVDHCNGGRTKGGAQFKDKWGNLAKGAKTRKNFSVFIVRRRLIKAKQQFIL